MHMTPVLQSHNGEDIRIYEADTEDALERYNALRSIKNKSIR